MNYSYEVKGLGNKYEVCREAFMHIYDISDDRIRKITKGRRADPSGTPQPDRRGQGK